MKVSSLTIYLGLFSIVRMRRELISLGAMRDRKKRVEQKRMHFCPITITRIHTKHNASCFVVYYLTNRSYVNLLSRGKSHSRWFGNRFSSSLNHFKLGHKFSYPYILYLCLMNFIVKYIVRYIKFTISTT